MNTKEFRGAVSQEILTWMAANFPAVPVVYENGPVPDEDKIGPVWLDVEVRWYSGKPMSIGEVVTGRYSGAISCSVYARGATGTGVPDDILDGLEPLLKTRRIGSSVISFPSRTVPTHLRGWYKTGLLFPFTLDR